MNTKLEKLEKLMDDSIMRSLDAELISLYLLYKRRVKRLLNMEKRNGIMKDERIFGLKRNIVKLEQLIGVKHRPAITTSFYTDLIEIAQEKINIKRDLERLKSHYNDVLKNLYSQFRDRVEVDKYFTSPPFFEERVARENPLKKLHDMAVSLASIIDESEKQMKEAFENLKNEI